MSKIMLVLDNSTDQDFLDKILQRLGFNVISMKRGVDLSEQLLDHFPEIVFASTLGKNEKILSALAKIKEARGKPKLVVVRQEKESTPLSADQKKIIDGVLYCPIDPFKLIDLLVTLTGEDIVGLRRRYNEMLQKEKMEKPSEVEFGVTTVVGKSPKSPETIYVVGDISPKSDSEESFEVYRHEEGPGEETVKVSNLINDSNRKKKYETICAELKSEDVPRKILDSKKLRDMQKRQSEKIQESQAVKENRNHFLQTLFTMKPIGLKRK